MKTKLVKEIEKQLKSKIDIVIINADFDNNYNLLRIFFDGFLAIKGIVSKDKKTIHIIFDRYFKAEKDLSYYCSNFGDKTPQELIDYVIVEYLKEYPHHKPGYFKEKEKFHLDKLEEQLNKKLEEYFKDKCVKSFNLYFRLAFKSSPTLIVTSTNPIYDEDYSGEFDSYMKTLSEEFGFEILFEPDNYGK